MKQVRLGVELAKAIREQERTDGVSIEHLPNGRMFHATISVLREPLTGVRLVRLDQVIEVLRQYGGTAEQAAEFFADMERKAR